MSYYTELELKIETPSAFNSIDEQIIFHLQASHPFARTAFEKNGSFRQEVPWETAIEDIAEFSKFYHLFQFVLRGIGDECLDRWTAYILNGNVRKVLTEQVTKNTEKWESLQSDFAREIYIRSGRAQQDGLISKELEVYIADFMRDYFKLREYLEQSSKETITTLNNLSFKRGHK